MSGSRDPGRRGKVKVVLAGTPHAGKASIVRALCRKFDAPPLHTLAVAGASAVVGDFVWPEPLPDGGYLTVEVHTFYGAPDHRALSRLLLQGADGIVFLADAEPARVGHAPAYLQEFLGDTDAIELDWGAVTVAVQYHRIETCPGFHTDVMNHFLQIPEGQLECFASTADPGDDATAAIEWVIRQIVQKAMPEQAAAG